MAGAGISLHFVHIFNLQHWFSVLHMYLQPVPKQTSFLSLSSVCALGAPGSAQHWQSVGREGHSAHIPSLTKAPEPPFKLPASPCLQQLLSASSAPSQSPASPRDALTHPVPPSQLPAQLLWWHFWHFWFICRAAPAGDVCQCSQGMSADCCAAASASSGMFQALLDPA